MARNPDHRILYLAPPLSDHEPLRLGEQTGCPERVSERAGHRATGLAMWGAAKRRRKWEAIPERKEGRKERRKEKGSLVWLSDVWQPSKKASLCKGRGAVPPTHWDADPTSPHSSQSHLVSSSANPHGFPHSYIIPSSSGCALRCTTCDGCVPHGVRFRTTVRCGIFATPPHPVSHSAPPPLPLFSPRAHHHRPSLPPPPSLCAAGWQRVESVR